MGSTESKEEVIIAQAGNSGGATTDGTNFGSFSVAEILGIIAFIGVLLIVVAYCWGIYKKRLTNKIRKELRKSTEQI